MYWATFEEAGQAGAPAKVLKLVGGLHWKPAMNSWSAPSPARPVPAWPPLPTPTSSSPPPPPPPPPPPVAPPQAARAAAPPSTPVPARNRRREAPGRGNSADSDMEDLPLGNRSAVGAPDRRRSVQELNPARRENLHW